MAIDPTTVLLSACPVSFTILRKSAPRLKKEGNGWSAEITFAVNYSDMSTFCQWVAGNVYTVNLSGGGTAQRIIPLSHPDFPKLLAMDIDAEATGTASGSDAVLAHMFSKAKVEVRFQSVPYPTDGSTPFMVETEQIGAEVYTIGGQKWSFESDGSPIDADAGIVVPTIVYNKTLYQCTDQDSATVRGLVGCVNSDTIFGISAGFLRFDGQNTNHTVSSQFVSSWVRQQKYTYRPIEWNKFLHPAGTWGYVSRSGGSRPYTLSAFAPLVA